MKSKKFIIFGAAAILALTPAIAGCANTFAASFRGVRKNTIVPRTSTVNFGNTSGINLKATSGSFNDALNNTWTYNITWVANTSFGTNADYSIIGSANNPAASITLTHTFEGQKTFSSFSADFSANNNGATGTITLSADDNSIGTHSFTGTDKSTASVNTSFNATKLTITIDNISKGIRAYGFSYTYNEEIPDEGTYYTVTFESNGGSSVSEQQVNNNDTTKAVEPNEPTQDGYVFAGWYDNENLEGNPFDFDTYITGNLTLYAKWEKIAATDEYNYAIETGNKHRFIGEVTAITGASQFYIQNGNNAMYIYDSVAAKKVKVGNTVDVYGLVSKYNNLPELTSLVYCDIVGDDTTNSQTPLTSTSNIVEANTFKYFEISGIQLASAFTTNDSQSSYNATFNVGDNTYTLHCGYKTYVNGGSFTYTDYSVNDYVSLKGVIAQHNGSMQLDFTYINKMAQYTVTFNSNGGSNVNSETVLEGNTVSEPEAPTKAQDENYKYTFAGWYIDEELEHEYDFNTPVTSDITLYADWNKQAIPATDTFEVLETEPTLYYSYKNPTTKHTDVLNNAFTGVSGTSYTDWENQSTGDTSIVYSGQSAGGNSSIQLRSKNSNSGVITSKNTSGKLAKSITVKFESHTGSTGQVDIYGKETAYSSPTDLYGNNKGTKLGSIVNDGSNDDATYTVEFDEAYPYIALRSNDGAIYLDEVQIEWAKTEYSFPKTGLRFNSSMTKSLWNKIASQGTISRYGVFVAEKEDLDYYLLDNEYGADSSFETAFNSTLSDLGSVSETLQCFTDGTEISDYYVDITGETTNPYAIDENNYKWAAYQSVDPSNGLKTVYSGVGYIVVNNTYYFMEQANESIVSLAGKYLNKDGYNSGSNEGSLYYLANL